MAQTWSRLNEGYDEWKAAVDRLKALIARMDAGAEVTRAEVDAANIDVETTQARMFGVEHPEQEARN